MSSTSGKDLPILHNNHFYFFSNCFFFPTIIGYCIIAYAILKSQLLFRIFFYFQLKKPIRLNISVIFFLTGPYIIRFRQSCSTFCKKILIKLSNVCIYILRICVSVIFMTSYLDNARQLYQTRSQI